MTKSKKKGQKDKQKPTKHRHKTKDRVPRTQIQIPSPSQETEKNKVRKKEGKKKSKYILQYVNMALIKLYFSLFLLWETLVIALICFAYDQQNLHPTPNSKQYLIDRWFKFNITCNREYLYI